MEFNNCTFNNCTQQDIHDNNIVVEQKEKQTEANTKVTEVMVKTSPQGNKEEDSYVMADFVEVKTSAFHDIIQNVDEEKLMAELHRRITPGTQPSVIGKILAYCHNERQWFIRKPKQEEFEREFPNCGNWYSIRSYFAERRREGATGIKIEL